MAGEKGGDGDDCPIINVVTIKTMLDDTMLEMILFDLYSYLVIIDGCLSPPRA